MAKSTGNLVLVSDLLADHSAAGGAAADPGPVPGTRTGTTCRTALTPRLGAWNCSRLPPDSRKTRQPRSPLCAAPWPMISTCPPHWPSPRRQRAGSPRPRHPARPLVARSRTRICGWPTIRAGFATGRGRTQARAVWGKRHGCLSQCRRRAALNSVARSSGKNSRAPSSSTTSVTPGIVSRSQ
jgi:hypothetical protein